MRQASEQRESCEGGPNSNSSGRTDDAAHVERAEPDSKIGSTQSTVLLGCAGVKTGGPADFRKRGGCASRFAVCCTAADLCTVLLSSSTSMHARSCLLRDRNHARSRRPCGGGAALDDDEEADAAAAGTEAAAAEEGAAAAAADDDAAAAPPTAAAPCAPFIDRCTTRGRQQRQAWAGRAADGWRRFEWRASVGALEEVGGAPCTHGRCRASRQHCATRCSSLRSFERRELRIKSEGPALQHRVHTGLVHDRNSAIDTATIGGRTAHLCWRCAALRCSLRAEHRPTHPAPTSASALRQSYRL